MKMKRRKKEMKTQSVSRSRVTCADLLCQSVKLFPEQISSLLTAPGSDKQGKGETHKSPASPIEPGEEVETFLGEGEEGEERSLSMRFSQNPF